VRIEASFKNLEKSMLVEQVIQKNIKKIERRVRLFKNKDALRLSLHLEKNPHRDEVLCWANFYLPFKVLKAHSNNENLTKAITQTFSALIRQLDKLKHRLETHLRKK
jgi:ribosome-associated translation inhibitor RaiA